MFVHVTFIPYLNAAGEFKTKPTQHSTKELRSTGINPDMIVCRSQEPIDKGLKRKIAYFCDVAPNAVVNVPDVSSIYEVPLILDQENIGIFITNRIKLDVNTESTDLNQLKKITRSPQKEDRAVIIAIIGKYVELEDAYISIRESLLHATTAIGVKLNLKYISSDIDELNKDELKELNGILIHGGFGERGIDGELNVVEYAITNEIPIFGICLGMHSMIIQLARRYDMKNANSTEFDKNTKYPVIDLIGKQEIKKTGGTMCLGSYDCKLIKDTKAYNSYNEDLIKERHRHKFEFNNKFRDKLQEAGLVISGTSPDNFLVEIIELKNHPWFLGCQFHPEFKSRPNKPHPLFISFINAALKFCYQRNKGL
jgi:CTP synthase